MEDIKLDSLKFVSQKKINQEREININNIRLWKDFMLIAWPCSVESKEQIVSIAEEIKNYANILRGGAFKPRSCPYSFQWLAQKWLEYLLKAKEQTKLPIITEVMDTQDIELVWKYTDIFQVWTRNMQNFSLLKGLGKTNKPVMLKRWLCATLQEWLNSAEYIMSEGNKNVLLCERWIRTFENYTRNTLDLSIVPAVKKITGLPIIVDPSHAVGRKDLIESMSLSSIASGADGLMIEVHNDPQNAFSDKNQQLLPKEFKNLANKIFSLKDFIDQ